MAMFEMEKLRFVCSACFVQCSVTLVAKKKTRLYTHN